MSTIRPRERQAIIQSLRAGVTPRVGLERIQVGRVNEVNALITDLDNISNGGSAFRIVIGDFGAGKSFFLQLIRYIALKKGLVTVNADLSPDRRLYSRTGQTRNLFRELTANMSTRAQPDGNAVLSVVEKFVGEQQRIAQEQGKDPEQIIKQSLNSLSEMVDGYDFANVVAAYWRAYNLGDENLKNAAVRYLRGEYTLRSDARRDLGVHAIIEDHNVYDHLKLWARFVRLAGYQGLLVNLDEMANVYKLSNSRSRNACYEQILHMLNNCLQGSVEGIGFLLGGTPDFMYDDQRGVFSYDALKTRLAENSFAKIAGVTDYSATVLPLNNLSPEDIYVLLQRIRLVFCPDDETRLLTNDALKAFLLHCSQNIGEAYFRTPRNTIKSFVDLLSVLDQNPALKWETLIGSIKIEREVDGETLTTLKDSSDEAGSSDGDDDELASFKL
ncbi:MAG: ATP-binding protein [Succinivibrio sp.]|nr:ATP-binding protein [Succinivibrio sp.]